MKLFPPLEKFNPLLSKTQIHINPLIRTFFERLSHFLFALLNVKETRLALGLTQEELAEVLDVAPRTVQRWESGQSQPRARTLSALQAALSNGLTFPNNIAVEVTKVPGRLAAARAGRRRRLFQDELRLFRLI